MRQKPTWRVERGINGVGRWGVEVGAAQLAAAQRKVDVKQDVVSEKKNLFL